MTQYDLDRAVATATGETLAEIHHLGFSLADPFDVCFDPEPGGRWCLIGTACPRLSGRVDTTLDSGLAAHAAFHQTRHGRLSILV